MLTSINSPTYDSRDIDTPLDIVDQNILRIMVTKGCTSGYAVWLQMKKESENVMVYKNIGRRVILLHKGGFIEEIKLDVENLHGRKDYKLTIEGMQQLIPYLFTHFEENEMQTIIEYMNKFGLDLKAFEQELKDRLSRILLILLAYQQYAGLEVGAYFGAWGDQPHVEWKDMRKFEVIFKRIASLAVMPNIGDKIEWLSLLSSQKSSKDIDKLQKRIMSELELEKEAKIWEVIIDLSRVAGKNLEETKRIILETIKREKLPIIADAIKKYQDMTLEEYSKLRVNEKPTSTTEHMEHEKEREKIRPIPEQRVLLNYYRSMEIILEKRFHVDPVELYNKIQDRIENAKESEKTDDGVIIPNKELIKLISGLESTSNKPITKLEKKPV